MKRTLIIFSSTLLLLSGCVSLSEKEQRAHLMQPSSLQESVQDSLASGYFQEGAWPDKEWWQTFSSDELNALMAETLQANPTLLSVKYRVEQARQETKIAKAPLFPFLFFDYSENWGYLSQNGLYRALNPDVPLNGNLLDLSLAFTYEFDFWGKNANLFHAALGREKAETAEDSEATLLISTAVAQAFFALKVQLGKKELLTSLLEVKQDIYDLQRLLRDHALSSELIPLFGDEEVLEIKKQVIGIEEEIAVTKHQINALAGRSPDTSIPIRSSLPLFPEKIALPTNLSIDLLARRPDLMAQIWRVEALAHEVGAAKADFYPNINLTALAGLEAFGFANLFKGSSKTGSLQPAIHLPIFTAGSIKANVRAKKAAFDAAVYEYNNQLLQAAKEVADLLVMTRAVHEKKQQQEQIIESAAKRLDITAINLSKGLDNQIQVYMRKQEVLVKKLQLLDLVYTQFALYIRLMKAMGGGYESPYHLPLQAEEGSS